MFVSIHGAGAGLSRWPIFNERLHLHLGFLARPRGRSLDVCPSLSSLSAAHLLVLQSEPSQYLQPAATAAATPRQRQNTSPYISPSSWSHQNNASSGGQLTAPPVTPRHAGMGWIQYRYTHLSTKSKKYQCKIEVDDKPYGWISSKVLWISRPCFWIIEIQVFVILKWFDHF